MVRTDVVYPISSARPEILYYMWCVHLRGNKRSIPESDTLRTAANFTETDPELCVSSLQLHIVHLLIFHTGVGKRDAGAEV